MKLPIDDVLPDLLAALREQARALLIAPPGAGKTTKVAPALLSESWCSGQIFLLVPRRLAARAAAEFMASRLGEVPGQTIGYATRLDSRVGATTRVVAMTHGVLLARIQSDPELAGVSAVLFDEVHERSLDNDLALALVLDAASALRTDLRIVAMSATPDVERFQRLLGNPPTIVSEGKGFPLEIRHVGRDAAARIEPQVAGAIRSALRDEDGSLLAFLPGVAEIERTAAALENLPAHIDLHKLHGGVEPALQRKALAAPPAGRRKVVLATSIAETSVTLEDVRIVIDSGLARRPRYDRGAGLTRLATERASRAAVTQRAGRAARQAPGVAIRLWEEAANASLPAHDPPEIFEADLSSLLLTCLLWGAADPRQLPFLDPPTDAALAEARRRLIMIAAITDDARTAALLRNCHWSRALPICCSMRAIADLDRRRPTSPCSLANAVWVAAMSISNCAGGDGRAIARSARSPQGSWPRAGGGASTFRTTAPTPRNWRPASRSPSPTASLAAAGDRARRGNRSADAAFV